MESIKKLYRIGHGPSSSHTMGPHHAAEIFGQRTPNADSYRVTLYGSLAATGKGHFTDKAIVEALQPKSTEIVWKPEEVKSFHTNAMHFEALDSGKSVIDKWLIYSIGGGALGDENTKQTQENIYEHSRISEILPYIERYGSSYWEYVASHEGSEIWDYLNECWKIMQSTIEESLQTEGVIPGGLYLKRKAAVYY
ncbi:MAG: serine dehydratase, partial [Bacteroidales bacterium]|nr:serine dehydratase [Bacteroidales bacterium]